MSLKILDILERENIPPNSRVTAVCKAISERHPGRVLGFLYYGSSLRDMDNPDKMLDFYVIVDSYKKTHESILRAALNTYIPPAVYYYERTDKDGTVSTCKYSIISISEFEKRCSGRAFLSMIWGRFSQPSTLLFPQSDAIKTRIMAARETAVRHMATQILPLVNSPLTSTQFWARGFRESYRTELRPEASDARSEEIVDRYADRYKDLMTCLYGDPDNGFYTLPHVMPSARRSCKTHWFWRRLIGKPMTAIRVINSAATFDGGLDYVLRKLHNHSGVSLEVTPAQRRHPVLWSPVLGWKLWRKGAFR